LFEDVAEQQDDVRGWGETFVSHRLFGLLCGECVELLGLRLIIEENATYAILKIAANNFAGALILAKSSLPRSLLKTEGHGACDVLAAYFGRPEGRELLCETVRSLRQPEYPPSAPTIS
jgi:hypothetical protein